MKATKDIILPLLLASIAGSIAGMGAEEGLFYVYNGQRIALKTDTSRLAVRLSKVPDEKLGEEARRLGSLIGSTTTKAESLGVGGWTILDSMPSDDTARATKLERAVADPKVDFVSPVIELAGGNEAIPSNAILIKPTEGTEPEASLRKLIGDAFGSLEEIGDTGIFKLTTKIKYGNEVLALANRLNDSEDIEFASPDFVERIQKQRVPNDPGFTNSWALDNRTTPGFDLGAVRSWDITTGSSSVVVVVFDEGIQQNHPDLNQIPGRDFTDSPVSGGGTGQYDSHGTAVAGCIAAKIDNGIGTAGIAPNARVASARIAYSNSDARWTFSHSWVVEGLSWARSIGARVTNHSYGGGLPNSAMDEAFRVTRDAGIIHFAASGNYGSSAILYPSSSTHVVAVGAAASNGTRASFSSYGQGLDFLAPGQAIYTTDETGSRGYTSGDYATVSGTSFASPYAAGVAALLLSREPSLTPDQVKARMVASCRDMESTGWDSSTGYGLLNAERTLTGSNPPPPSADDHGNNMATATPVTVPGNVNGVIEVQSDEDFFRFTLASATEVTIGTDSSIDTYGYLLDSSGAVITHDDDSGAGYNFRMSRTLGAGTYYVRVHTYGFQSTGSYRLNLTSASMAVPRIAIQAPGTDFGSVAGGSGVEQSFVIDNLGTGNLLLTASSPVRLSGDGAEHFRVIHQPATNIAPSRSSSFTVRFQPAGPGTFRPLVVVDSNDPDTPSYRFTITGQGTVPRDDHGNMRDLATRIDASGTIRGSLETAGDVDYFVFELLRRSVVSIISTGSTDVVGILENRRGKVIMLDDDGAGYPNFRLERRLKKGTYYLRVNGYNSGVLGDYQVHVSF